MITTESNVLCRREFIARLKRALHLEFPDLSPDQAILLYHIDNSEMCQSDMLRRGYYLGTNINYTASKLAAQSFLVRWCDRNDRRNVWFKASPKGQKVRDLVAREFRIFQDHIALMMLPVEQQDVPAPRGPKCECCGHPLPEDSLPYLALTKTEAMILRMASSHYPYGVHMDALVGAVYADDQDGAPLTADKIIQTVICRLNKKIKRESLRVKSRSRMIFLVDLATKKPMKITSAMALRGTGIAA